MPSIGYPYNLIQGLSAFWQQFFADSPQLESLYKGETYLLAQAYLGMLENVLSLSIVDCPLFSREFWRLITIREDQVRYVEGVFPADDRHVFATPDNIAGLITLDNRVVEPTAALEVESDFDFTRERIAFYVDPTNPAYDGNPLPGYARRKVDVAVGGGFDATSRGALSWSTDKNVRKGDIIRLIVVNGANQRSAGNFPIVLVRDDALYVDPATPIPSGAGLTYVILRRPSDSLVTFEPMAFVGTTATLAHTRLIPGTVRVFAKRLDGADVRENEDYAIDYELGKVIKLTTWDISSVNRVTYEWLDTIVALDTTGVAQAVKTARVIEMAFWAPDVLVDKQRLSLNFGTLIGKEALSTEAYRAFLRGVFQLYVLGPVLERFESALNVVLGLPVIQDDGEVLLGYDATDPNFNRVTTSARTYDFPKATPLRSDVTTPANYGVLTFHAFEPLTTAIMVTDYVQDPTWWHHITIPAELMTAALERRQVSPLYVENVIDAADVPCIDDPGLYIDADEEGFQPPPGHKVYRRKMAFVVMDRMLKTHMFYVRFDPSVFAQTGIRFAVDPTELQRLIISAKPSHTFAYVEPLTVFLDEVVMADGEDRPAYYQPQRYVGADPDAPELYASPSDMPDLTKPYVKLGLIISPTVFKRDRVLFTDDTLAIDVNGWNVGDYYHYEFYSGAVAFAGPVTLGHVPGAPRRRRVVRVYINGTVGGVPLVEGTDYSVNYATGLITPLTVWDGWNVPVSFIQLNIGNEMDAAPNTAVGDVMVCADGVDPALVRSSAVGYSVNNGDDISCVERALTITIM